MEVDLFQFSIPCFVPSVQLDGTSFTSSSNQTSPIMIGTHFFQFFSDDWYWMIGTNFSDFHHQSSAIFPDSPPIPPGLKNMFQELQQGSGAVLLRFPPGWLENVGEDVCERAFLGLCGLVMRCDRHRHGLYMNHHPIGGLYVYISPNISPSPKMGLPILVTLVVSPKERCRGL